MKGLHRHRFIYRLARFFLRPFLTLRFHYRYDKVVPQTGPAIVLCNHATDWDPLLVGLAFPKHMYFVASDHIFRWGLASRLLRYFVAPIARIKSAVETHTVNQVIKTLKAGESVCIFAEGVCTFNGETGPISDATGKLVKFSRAALVTYRLDGGYLSRPRWSDRSRSGPMRGSLMGQYSAETLQNMSAEGITALIRRDLYVDANAVQRQTGAKYKGRLLARSIETALYLCPFCGRMATLESLDDEFFCSCGLRGRYTEEGRLISLGSPSFEFETVLAWDRWQKSQLTAFISHADDTPLASDQNQRLSLFQRDQDKVLLATGTLFLYADRLELFAGGGNRFSFPLAQISEFGVRGRDTLLFSVDEIFHYEIACDIPRSATKYIDLFRTLKDI